MSLFLYSSASYGARAPKEDKRKQKHDIATLLYLAGTEPPPFTYRYRLQAAEMLKADGRSWQARRMLEDIAAEQLADAEYQLYAPLYADLLLTTGSAQQALDLLYQSRLSRLLSQIPGELRLQIYLMRIRTQLRNNRPMLAFQESIRISPLLADENARISSNRAIWETLMSVPIETLQQQGGASTDAFKRIATGWLQLALLCRDYETDAKLRHRAMQAWLGQFPEHPATKALPPEAQLLTAPPQTLARHVALLLPLSGQLADAGQAVRDGFLTAWYAAVARGDVVPQVSVLDTGKGDVLGLYRKAVGAGARMIIGPLTRDNVNTLQRLRLTVPVLSLNYLHRNRHQSNLYQFGLSPEDELEQLVSYGTQRHWNNALLLRPKNNWSEQYAQVFTNLWKHSDKHTIDEYAYLNKRDISIVVEQALHMDQSKQRQRTMQRLLGTNIHSTSRRRQDIGWVVFLGNAPEARLLTPVLGYYRANTIPLLSTARAFDGNRKDANNADLNSIIFTESPWLLEPREFSEALVSDNHQITRMYGMGVDAWNVLPWLNALRGDDDLSLYAASGRLSMAHGRIKRTLLWATIQNGQPKQTLGSAALAHLSQLQLPNNSRTRR